MAPAGAQVGVLFPGEECSGKKGKRPIMGELTLALVALWQAHTILSLGVLLGFHCGVFLPLAEAIGQDGMHTQLQQHQQAKLKAEAVMLM